jgi:alpha-L-fucosidase
MEAGARFAGPVAEHADGFAMWDSQVTKWNAKRMGPGRDVVAEMRRAVHRRGLKFVTSLHHQWKWGWYPTWNAETDTAKGEYAGLYGPTVPPGAWGTKQPDGRLDVMKPDPRPSPEFAAEWLAKVKEVVTKYEPDLLWFDNRMQTLPESTRMEMASFFYNEAQKQSREVVLTYKEPDLKQGTATIDLERSRMPDIYPDPWLTDSSVSSSSWAYASGIQYYSTDRLIDDLVDIVSKNGCLLLNIAPHPNGTIPEEQQERLRGIGRWLKVNGEAIYGTRPWNVFGEGPTTTLQGHLADLKFDGFAPEDVRFTRSKDGNTLYAIALGWPTKSRELVIRSMKAENFGKRSIRSAEMLGCDEAIQWIRTADGLKVAFPQRKPCEHAFVFRIQLE